MLTWAVTTTRSPALTGFATVSVPVFVAVVPLAVPTWRTYPGAGFTVTAWIAVLLSPEALWCCSRKLAFGTLAPQRGAPLSLFARLDVVRRLKFARLSSQPEDSGTYPTNSKTSSLIGAPLRVRGRGLKQWRLVMAACTITIVLPT